MFDQLVKKVERWADRELREEMMDQEEVRLLEKLDGLDPKSDEYRTVLVEFERFHTVRQKDRAIVESKKGRRFDAATTFVLAVMTMTTEYWTPITSNWGREITRRFHHKDDLL